MTKKLVLILLAVCAVLCLTGCQTENYNNFTPVSMPSDLTVESNGGVVVRVGEYTYFMNGYSSNSSSNFYNEVVTGAICRIKTEDIDKLNDEDFTDAHKQALYEIVVPKLIYQANSYSSGLYVKGDRIYFTTPNIEKDNTGTAKTSELVIMSAKLDGSNVKIHHTIAANTMAVNYIETNNTIYAVYVYENVIKCVNLNTNEVTEAGEDIAASYTDGTTVYALQTVYYTNVSGDEVEDKFNRICTFTPGGEFTVVLSGDTEVEGVNDIKYTLTRAADGKLFYTATGSNEAYAGTFVLENGTARRLTEASNLTYYHYKNGIVLLSDSWVVYAWYEDGTLCTEKLLYTSSFTPYKIIGDVLYYTSSSILYKVDLSEGDLNRTATALNSTTMTSSNFTYDIIGDEIFFIGSSDSLLRRAVINEDGEIVETLINLTED